MSAEYETNLLVVKEVMLYNIPPRQTSRGYRATEWDVNQFLWSGRLRVTAQGSKCFIRFEDLATGALFCQCTYELGSNGVEQVTDSSRYFVVKVTDSATGRHAFLGLGFQDRNEAFDFNVALQDFGKHLNKQKELASKPAVEQAKVDYSLKEGQTISINLGSVPKRAKAKEDEQAQTQTPFLAPPTQQSKAPAPSGWVQF